MAEKVLVLCQRRIDVISGDVLVESKIQPLLTILLGEGVEREIQYISPIPGADIVGEFGNNDFTRANFKENDYAVIILNTCPFQVMDLDIVYKYLKPDGKLVLSNYLNGTMAGSSITDSGTYKALVERSVFEKSGFVYASHERNAVVFNKVIKGGRKYRTKRKTIRRRKTRRSTRSTRSRK
jgi:hypothetical protein